MYAECVVRLLCKVRSTIRKWITNFGEWRKTRFSVHWTRHFSNAYKNRKVLMSVSTQVVKRSTHISPTRIDWKHALTWIINQTNPLPKSTYFHEMGGAITQHKFLAAQGESLKQKNENMTSWGQFLWRCKFFQKTDFFLNPIQTSNCQLLWDIFDAIF